MTKGDLVLMRDLAQEMLEDRYPLEFLAPPSISPPPELLMKKGRPKISDTDIRKIIANLRRTVRRKRESSGSSGSGSSGSVGSQPSTQEEIQGEAGGTTNGADLKHDTLMRQLRVEEEVGEALIALSKRAGWYTYRSATNGKEVLSLRTGLLLSQLVSECSCSMRKIPDIVATVLVMVFGMIPQALMDQFTRAVSAFEQAVDRVALVLKGKTAEKFKSGTFRAACLCMNASNKGGKNLVTKPFTTLDADGFVRQGCFNMDLTVTKKADLGSDLTIQALTTELGETGLYTIKGGSCDKYGVAEVAKALRHIDLLHMSSWQANLARNLLLMTLTSARYPTIKYLYGLGYFASERIRSCMVHAFECVLKLLLIELVGK
jgi:hypothetical protein